MNGIFVVAALFSSAVQSEKGSGDESLIKELRSRGLSQLSEAYSRRKLADASLDPAAREAAAVELSSAASRRASTETDAASRRAGWTESDSIIEPFLRAAEGNDPEHFEFRLRHALMIRDRAETVVELLKAVPNDKELVDDARIQARKATDLLSKLAAELRRRSDQLAGGDPKKFVRIGNLDNLASYHTGIAWVISVIASPTGDERNRAADEAEKRLRDRTRSFSQSPLDMDAVLWLGRLYKEMERYDEALQVVSVFDVHPESPAIFRQRADLLSSQILLAQNKPAAALVKLNVPEDKRLRNSGEWDVTLFEAMLRGARKDIQAAGRKDEAIELLASLEKKYGGYWKARGEQTLARFGDPEVIGDDAKLLAKVATLRRERKEYDVAIGMFDRAVQLEASSGAAESAARIGLSAASTVLEKGDAAAAAERFLKIADQATASPLAADALLGAARAIFPAYQAGDAKAKVAYRSALDRLLDVPNAEPSIRHEAAWLRSRVATAEKDNPTAIARLKEIPATHARASTALGSLAALYYESLLGTNDRLAGERTVAAALDDLDSRMKAIPNTAPDAAKNKAQAAWVLARIIAAYQGERLPVAVALVESMVVDEPSFPKPQNRVWPFLLGWKLRLGDAKGAIALIQRGYSTNPKELAVELLRLSPLDDDLLAAERTARIETIQSAVDHWLARSDKLPDQTRTSFKLLSGEALAARKDYSESVRLLRQLRQESPRDARIPKALGAVLFAAGEYRESLNEWSTLVGGLPQGKEDWLAAVVEACRCHLELGDRLAAARLLELVEKNHKGKGSEKMRKKLADLKVRVDR